MSGTLQGHTHIIGAGLAGLATAVALSAAGHRVSLYEAAAAAGGRCRSYDDPTLGIRIDNGNHLILSGNRETMAFTRTVGSTDQLVGPAHARFPFVDLQSTERWTLSLSDSRVPWWILDPRRRVPGTGIRDYLSLVKLLRAKPHQTIADRLDDATLSGTLYHRLLHPLLLAALNTEPREGSAALAAAVIRETLSAGGQACRPLVARTGLSDVFVDPAIAFIQARGGKVHLGRRLRSIDFATAGARATLTASENRKTSAFAQTLNFGDGTLSVGQNENIVLALPTPSATALLPGLHGPDAFRSIVNAHFKVVPPPGCAPVIGVINGTAEWVFAFDNRLSVTISGADRLLDMDREMLARTIWQDVVRTVWGKTTAPDSAGAMEKAGAVQRQQEWDSLGALHPLPAWQIVRERRATFAALPEQDAKRPGTITRWKNIFLAGDWTNTGLPATIEGAIRSGNRAAAAITQPGAAPTVSNGNG